MFAREVRGSKWRRTLGVPLLHYAEGAGFGACGTGYQVVVFGAFDGYLDEGAGLELAALHHGDGIDFGRLGGGAGNPLIAVGIGRAIDEDDSDVEDTVEWIRDRLARAMPTFDLDACVIDIPGSALIEVLYRLKRGSDDRQIARYLAAIEHPRLKSRRTSKLRGYRWTGANAPPGVKQTALDVERFLRM